MPSLDPADVSASGETTAVASKLRAPRVPAGALRRPRLLEVLAGSMDSGIVVVEAPAGCGKTTLLAQWAEADHARRFGWVTLDETDDDPVQLWRLIVGTLGVAAPEASLRAEAAIDRPAPDIQRAVLPAVLNGLEALDGRVVLVLDNWQVINDAPCAGSIGRLLDRLPQQATVVISTRTEPALNLARLAVHGRVSALTAAELSFSHDEVERLMTENGITSSPEAAARVMAETDGWAAAVHLSTRGDSRVASHRRRALPAPGGLLHSFMAEEMLDPLERGDREFLRCCSSLSILRPSLCDHVAQTTGSSQRLARLSKTNLLLSPVDDPADSFRMHPLLRDVLAGELATLDPARLDRAHRAAATWLEDEGQYVEAVEHAFRASDDSLASRLICTHWLKIIMTGRLTTVVRWIDHYDDDDLARYPFLLVAGAWTAGFAGDWAGAWRRSRLATRVQCNDESLDGTASFASARALMLAGLALDGVTAARLQAEIAYRLEGPTSPWRAMAAALLGAAHLALGDDDGARVFLEEAATVTSGPMGVATYAMGQLALLEASAGRWEESERIAARAVEDIRRLRIENLVSSGSAFAAHAAAAAHQGDAARAHRRLRMLNPLLPGLSDAMPYDAFQLHLRTAEIYHDLDDRRSAAAHAAAAHRYLLVLRDGGVLEDRLAALANASWDDVGEFSPGVQPDLTPREREILALMPSDLSLRELGGELFLSRDTIKTYTSRIYHKLNVSSRSAAVTRAVEIGLL